MVTTTAQVTTEVISKSSGTLPYFDVLVFALGVTAITFIAIIFFLDHQAKNEPILLPEKTK